MSAFSALLSPLSYLRIKHPLKRFVDRFFPICGAVIAVCWVYFWHNFNLFGQSGLMIGSNGLLQIVTGFFITSLAAIATFNGSTYRIDDVLEGEKAILRGDILTRRQFLCFLFAYLSLLSLALYFYGAVGIAAASTLHVAIDGHFRDILRVAFTLFYSAGFAHLLGTTLIGLIFLAGRVPGVGGQSRYVASARARAQPEVSERCQ